MHTEYSMLDGLGSIEDYVSKASDLGQTALAITDHGTMCGIPSFYHACRKAEVEPLLGVEFYFVEDAAWRPAKGQPTPDRHHVVLLARGQKGYEVLTQLSTETHRKHWYKPLLDRAMVEQLGDDAQHLVCLSGCAASEISTAVLAGELEEAAYRVQWWREAFPHFYIELQHHGTEFDRKLNTGLIKLARKFRVPHIITNDPHYVVEEDSHHHDSLLAVQTASDRDDPDRFRFDGSGYHLRTAAEMRRAFREYESDIWRDGAARTEQVARLCHARIPQWERRTWHIPHYPDVPDAYQELRRLSMAGLRERGFEADSQYRERVHRELKAFKETNLSDFMLITQDLVRYAREQGIPVGPGRGSVCGTLVGYLLGIHKIDPIKYNLMFERFLNPARPRMPDVDTDFGPARRAEMFEYAATKYGIENVVHVAAFQNMKYKAAFRSLAKSYGITFVEANRLAKMLPESVDGDADLDEMPLEFTDAIAPYPELRADLLRLAGLKRAVSAHPAGVIIADPQDDIRKLVPEMYLPSSKRMCGQYDLEAVEEMGLLKEDFLGLRTLETIASCVELIQRRHGVELDPDTWDPDREERDDEVYAMLARGETAGVFQMEGATNTKGIKDIVPTQFEDIVSCTSLYRTGAISAGFPDVFKRNRLGGETIKYAHPALTPILESSYGVVLYQEQVMEMGERIAGFSMVQVDDIKEAIKHKKSKLMAEMKPLFIRGAQATVGATRAQATEMWRMIEGYSGYGFNRSHAVAYSFLTYQTARLKCLYPNEFTVALLRTVPSDKSHAVKRLRYLYEFARHGGRIRWPDINRSAALALPTPTGLRFGFADVGGIGPKVAARLVEGRPRGGYVTLEQVEAVVRNQGAMQALAEAGAFHRVGWVRTTTTQASARLAWGFKDRLGDDRAGYEEQVIRPGSPEAADNDGNCVLVGEVTLHKRGETKSGRPYLTIHVRLTPAEAWNVRLWDSSNRPYLRDRKRRHLWELLGEGAVVQVTGEWEEAWENVSVAHASQVQIIHPAPEKKATTVMVPTTKAVRTPRTRAGANYSTALDDERFDEFRWLAVERHQVYLKREVLGLPAPWTDDPLLRRYHFCNVFRRLDRTSLIIQKLCRRQRRDPGMHYVMAVLGRHTNRDDLLKALPRDWYNAMDQSEFESWLGGYTLGSAAYKIHTPMGINRRDGIAELVYTELGRCDEVAEKLLACTSLREAHGVLETFEIRAHHAQGLGVAKNFRISGLTAYQVLLDLVETGFWPKSFDDEWCFVGIGAVRGARLLTGVPLDVTRQENMGGITQPLRDFGMAVIDQVVRRMQVEWPPDWPVFDIHTAETMCCEYDKYKTKESGHLHGRRYQGE